MSFNKQHFFTICMILFLFFWMFTSTYIVASVKNETKATIYSNLETTHMGLSFMEATEFTQIDTLYDTISLSGYIYNISYATDDEATRSLILHSDKKNYIIPLTELKNPAYIFYPEIDKTPKVYTGFGLQYAPLTLDDGIYSLILQVEENGIPASRLDSGYILKKVQGHSSLIYQPSEAIDSLSETDLVGWANGGFSEMSFDTNGRLMLKGWGIIDNINADTTEVILQVFDNNTLVGTYNTTKENILYIADYFNNSDYLSSGFKAAIPDVDIDNLTIWLYIKYNGGVYKCPYYFVPNANKNNLELVTS